jgi:hypothetical protein
MKRIYILIIFLLLAGSLYSQSSSRSQVFPSIKAQYESIWGELEEIDYNDSAIYYKKGSFTVTDKPVENISIYEIKEMGFFIYNKIKYYIRHSVGQSPESRNVNELEIYNEKDKYFSCSQICIPGSDALYTVAKKYNWNFYDKYILVNSKWSKVKQLFYYWGRNSITAGAISLYDNANLKNKIATISEGAFITIIGIIDYQVWADDTILLVQSASGLTGYIKPKRLKDNVDLWEKIEFDIPLFNMVAEP